MKRICFGFIAIFVFASSVLAKDYYALGVNCFKQGDYVNAEKNFTSAVKISPKNVNARYYLAQTFLVQKKITEATDQYNRIIIINPSCPAARLSVKGLALIAQSYEGKTSGSMPLSDDLAAYSDNYLDYVLPSDGVLMKWEAFPIKVYIEPKKQQAEVKRAFDLWQEKTPVSFRFVNSEKQAQITVDFKDQLETSSTKESYIAGFSKPYYQNNHISKSEIHILSKDPETGQDINNEDIFSTALHEIGHSLGMKGHSPNKDDVMAAQTSGVKPSLSKRDINTMTLICKVDQKTLAARPKSNTDLKLQQALDYVKNTPEKAVGWANLGDVYKGKRMYSDAILNYKKAISIEPGKAELYNLIGVTYSESGDSQKALDNYKKACDLDKSNTFYMYQLGQQYLKMGQKDIGKSYLDTFLKANPQAMFDEKIKVLLESYN